ncbi:isovaleryl-CoA dehydrogenase [Caldimonas aquatica]|uniref:Isovaleryl-CoA dehydrogenase n=1 Tax=Caldimonas aquatica TaxID=376175 RepID=A0ABY6MQ59_9BURK|nr:isovaleryl-CoA dehydrogenase [Schlegelella aquatica]UZD53628.1 isovaleryl-CoA dehydrogenase [Schlegelella aquatica]
MQQATLSEIGAGRTHDVINQSAPLVDVNLYQGNRALRDALVHHLGASFDDRELQELGALAGSAHMQQHARLANVHTPELRTHDRQGRRIDQVEFHPSYHALMEAAIRHGLHAAAWVRPAHGHLLRAAGFMLFTELEPSVLCPVSMTYAATPALRANPALHAAWFPKLASTVYDPRFIPADRKSGVTMGMGMTEKQGGSDVRANTTQAVYEQDTPWGRCYRLAGHKWFFSAPMCDAFLVLAQAPGGLSCFFLPRWLPDGTVNALHIQRLKDKLGNKANASSEVEFLGAQAWLVGEEGRGVPQILEMGTHTRLDCALGTAGLMRHALALALHHTAQREAFGRPLIAHPLMRNVLADLAVEVEAAIALALRLAHAFDAEGDPHEAAMRRVLTPVAKYWICKRGSAFAQEAMECLGGNGYVEERGEGVMARIYREMPVNSIWEGAGNVMALDLLRALRKRTGTGADVVDALAAEWAAGRSADARIDRRAAQVLQRLEDGVEEVEARRLAQDVALVTQACLLRRHAPEPVFEAFCASRLEADWGQAFGTLPAATDFEGILARAMPV